jgi:hypothetical protein
MRCPNCGNENPPDYMFCDECGARLGSDAGSSMADTAVAPVVPLSSGAQSGTGEPAPYGGGGAGTDSSGGGYSSSPYDSGVGAGTGAGTDTGASPVAPIAPISPIGSVDSTDTSGSDSMQGMQGGPDPGMGYDGSQQSLDTSAPAGVGLGDSGAATPATEDTIPASPVPSYDFGGMDTGGAGTQDSMPGVTPIAEEESGAGMSPYSGASESYNAGVDEASSPFADLGSTSADAQDQGVAVAAPVTIGEEETVGAQPAGQGAGQGTTWASDALEHLDSGQQAMARGDWAGFGQSMNELRSILESAVRGGAAGAMGASVAAAPAVEAQPSSTIYSAAPSTGIGDSSAAAMPSGGTMDSEPSYAGAAGAATLEPAAEAGTLDGMQPIGAAAGVVAAGAASSPDIGIAPVAPAAPTAEGEAGVARLVVIATGAELSLPDQEEITVGREDPSSGIFPDIDLTPYGGEDGGVSRRHARMLHIGDDYFVEDLQSTNYTKLDGQRLPAHVRERLEDGARLDFGRVAVIFRRS